MWEADREPDRDEKRERREGRLCCVIVLLSLGETYLHMYSVTMAMYQLKLTTYKTLLSQGNTGILSSSSTTKQDIDMFLRAIASHGRGNMAWEDATPRMLRK